MQALQIFLKKIGIRRTNMIVSQPLLGEIVYSVNLSFNRWTLISIKIHL